MRTEDRKINILLFVSLIIFVITLVFVLLGGWFYKTLFGVSVLILGVVFAIIGAGLMVYICFLSWFSYHRVVYSKETNQDEYQQTRFYEILKEEKEYSSSGKFDF